VKTLDGRLARDRIEQLAMHEPIVHQCRQLYKQGALTYEEALIHMVDALVASNKAKMDMMLKHMEICTVSTVGYKTYN
jgi:hypothetical protein